MKSRKFLSVLCAVAIMASVSAVSVYAEDIPAAPTEPEAPVVATEEGSTGTVEGNIFAANEVWELTDPTGAVESYYLLFTSETSGRTCDTERGIGVPFEYEVLGDGAYVFHMAAADDNTPVTVTTDTNGVIYVTVGELTYTAKLLNTTVELFEQSFVTVTMTTPDDIGEAQVLDDATVDATVGAEPPVLISANPNAGYSASGNAITINGEDFKGAYTKTGKDTIAYTTFKQSQAYSLQFTFTTTAGVAKTYTASSVGTKGTVAYIPIQDMLDKLKLAAGDIATLTVTGDSIADVVSISFDKTTTIGTKTTVTGNDENPATGVELAIIPVIAAAGIAGGAFFLKKKKK